MQREVLGWRCEQGTGPFHRMQREVLGWAVQSRHEEEQVPHSAFYRMLRKGCLGMGRSRGKRSKPPHLHLADDQQRRVAVVAQQRGDVQVSLAQPRPRAVPAHHALARCSMNA